MLKVFGRRNSSNVQKVMWLVGELELPHEHVPRGGSFGGNDSAEHRAMSPTGKVPAIDDGGVLVWESHAILQYLAAQYGRQRFWSDSPAERAHIDPWLHWVETSLQPSFSGVFWGYYRTPEAERDHRAIKESLERTEHEMRLLDRVLASKPFVAGDTLTLADIPVGAQLFRYFTLDIERPALPHMEAYYRRLQERPAYREHVMVAYDELRGRLSF
jgi:glutathione S-transferase